MNASHSSIDLLILTEIGERVAGSNLVVVLKPWEKGGWGDRWVRHDYNSETHIFLES